MKNKFLVTPIFLIAILILSSNVQAANEKVNSQINKETPIPTTITIKSQQELDSNDNIKQQEKNSTINSKEQNSASTANKIQSQQQEQNSINSKETAQQLDLISTVNREQAQQQNEIKNQGKDNKIQNEQKNNDKNNNTKTPETPEQRRSVVANTVQQMFQVADRNGGIGQQIKVIAQTQTQNQDKLENSIQKINKKSSFAKFFTGPDYNEINNATKTIEENNKQIQQLKEIKNQLTNTDEQNNLEQQIQNLEQVNLETQNVLNTSEKGFSLLGWMFKMFSK